MDEYSIARAYLTSLGIGLLIGFERERSQVGSAGLRTFALVALFGTTAAWLARNSESPWLIAAALLGVLALWLFADWRNPERIKDPGMTTGVALLLCFLLGTMLAYGMSQLAVSIAVVVTLLLYFKTELHGFTRRLSREELLSFLQFAVLAFVLLPLLPDGRYGPYGALNPARIGQLVALICAINLAGYAALRLFNEHQAAALTGVLGGLVSSTATTLSFARHQRDGIVTAPLAALGILLANLTVLLRLGAIAAVLAPKLLPQMVPALAGGLLVGLLLPLLTWWRLPKEQPAIDMKVGNPAELKTAFGFALLFAIVLVVTAAANDLFGARGLYVVAAISGLTDLDAITLSTLNLFRAEQLAATSTVAVVLIAFFANLVFKFGIAASIGGASLARIVAAGYALCGTGLVAGYLIGTSLF